MRIPPIIAGFDSTYEGLKRALMDGVIGFPLTVSTVPMRA